MLICYLQIILEWWYRLGLTFMKHNSPRYSPRETPALGAIQLGRTQSKFNRKPALGEQVKKRSNNSPREDQRICFMPPDRINMLLTTSGPNSFLSAKTPTSSNYNCSPQFLKEMQSQIHDDTNGNCKMNDSLLSMYNQLNVEKETEVTVLRSEVARLSEVVESLQAILRAKESEMWGLQEFMMSRENFISEVHAQLAEVNQKNGQLLKQKDLLCEQTDNLRKIFRKEKEEHQTEMKAILSNLQSMKSQLEKTRIENQTLRQEINRAETNNMKTFFLSPHSLQNLPMDPDEFDISPSKHQPYNQSQRCIKLNSAHSALKLKLAEAGNPAPVRSSYHELLSSRSGRLPSNHDRDDDSDELCRKSKISSKRCGCQAIIESLYQKIRYNQIQIDILKRVKVKGESIRTENERLKKHNSNLLNRIEYIADRNKLHQQRSSSRKKNSSESSLQLSLSPGHKNQRY